MFRMEGKGLEQRPQLKNKPREIVREKTSRREQQVEAGRGPRGLWKTR